MQAVGSFFAVLIKIIVGCSIAMIWIAKFVFGTFKVIAMIISAISENDDRNARRSAAARAESENAQLRRIRLNEAIRRESRGGR